MPKTSKPYGSFTPAGTWISYDPGPDRWGRRTTEDNLTIGMQADEGGRWVSLEDYEKLLHKVKELERKLQRGSELVNQLKKAADENSRRDHQDDHSPQQNGESSS